MLNSNQEPDLEKNQSGQKAIRNSQFKKIISKKGMAELDEHAEQDYSSYLTKDLIESLDDSFENVQPPKGNSDGSNLIYYLMNASYTEPTDINSNSTYSENDVHKRRWSCTNLDQKNLQFNQRESIFQKIAKSESLGLNSILNGFSEVKDQMNDDYFMIEDGKAGWICIKCSNFNYESSNFI